MIAQVGPGWAAGTSPGVRVWAQSLSGRWHGRNALVDGQVQRSVLCSVRREHILDVTDVPSEVERDPATRGSRPPRVTALSGTGLRSG